MDTKILRQKILDLAIHGKLVEKEGEWEEVTIKSVCKKIFAGGDKPLLVQKTPTDNCNIPIYANAVANNGLYGYTENAIVHDPAITISARGTIGFVCVRKEPFVPIVRLITAIPQKELVELEYLAVALKAKVAPKEGSSIPQLTVPTFKELIIPLPPLAEQQRIVAAVEQWMSLVDIIESGKENLQQSIALAKNKILDLAIKGKLVEKEGEWEEKTLGEVFVINPKNKCEDDTSTGFVPMTNIQDGFGDSFVFEERPWKEIKKGFTHFADGDIAVAKISPCFENRKSMVLRNLPSGIGAGTTELFIFRAPINVLPKFALFFFKSNYFISKGTGTFAGAVGQQRVGRKTIEAIPFPLPPLSEQHRIVAKIEELFTQLDIISNALK